MEPDPSKSERRLRSMVDSSVERWRRERALDRRPDAEIPDAEVPEGSLQRPRGLGVASPEQPLPPKKQKVALKVSWLQKWRIPVRLFVWFVLAVRYFAGNGWDRLLGRDDLQQGQAKRLTELMQEAGGTLVKIGQQMSMRIDIIPYVYARELEKLLDKVPPFPAEKAIALIKDAAGGSLARTFLSIDTRPIGSASIACVYQAVLRNGDRVAIKVRRPGISRDLAVDVEALALLMRFLELFYLPPGFSKNLIGEMRSVLNQELDFISEARFGELFGRSAKKNKLKFVTAPWVYFDISNTTVLVAEFVSGYLVSDLLAAVERSDRKALETLDQLDIDPRKVARRLLKITRFGGFEDLFFHADLHPANVIVQPHSKLVLIDFGSCGSFTDQERLVWRRLLYAQANGDVGAMAQAAASLLEPLPPIDVDDLLRKLEEVFWEDIYGYKSKNSEWWERTSASMWISFLRLAREFRIPFNLNFLRMVRISMLADTVAARLDNTIDHYQEYHKYLQEAGSRAKNTLIKRVKSLFSNRTFVDLLDLYETGADAVYRVQHLLDIPIYRFRGLIYKAAFTAKTIIETLVFLLAATGVIVLIQAGLRYVRREPVAPWDIAAELVSNGWYQTGIAVVALSAIRAIYFRLSAHDR